MLNIFELSIINECRHCSQRKDFASKSASPSSDSASIENDNLSLESRGRKGVSSQGENRGSGRSRTFPPGSNNTVLLWRTQQIILPIGPRGQALEWQESRPPWNANRGCKILQAEIKGFPPFLLIALQLCPPLKLKWSRLKRMQRTLQRQMRRKRLQPSLLLLKLRPL